LPAPPNAPVSRPEAAYRALGWDSGLSARAQRAFLARAAALAPDSRLNLNTASPEILRAVLGIDARAAQRIVGQREHRALMSAADIATVGGVPVAPGATPIGGLPGRTFRIRIEAAPPNTRAVRPVEVRLGYATEGDWPLRVRTVHRTVSAAFARGGEGDGGWEDLPQSPALLAAR
jgi:hypothetical protein